MQHLSCGKVAVAGERKDRKKIRGGCLTFDKQTTICAATAKGANKIGLSHQCGLYTKMICKQQKLQCKSSCRFIESMELGWAYPVSLIIFH